MSAAEARNLPNMQSLPASNLGFFGDYLQPLHAARHESWVLASDYGGEHQDPTYRTYGFLLVSEASFVRWRHIVSPLRAAIGDAREFAYKRMRSDVVRQRHLASFLSAADALSGAWLTVAFNADAYDSMSGRGAGPLAGWGEANVRKAAIVIQNALTLLRFCLPHGGNVFWISDHDSLLSNPAMKQQFGAAVSDVSSVLVPMKDLRIRMRIEDLSIEGERAALTDLCAYADLGAGAMGARTTSKEPLAHASLAPWETEILKALTPRPGTLQRVALAIEFDGDIGRHYRLMLGE